MGGAKGAGGAAGGNFGGGGTFGGAVPGANGSDGDTGGSGQGGIKGSESNNQDDNGTVTAGVAPLSVTLDPLTATTYGGEPTASVTVAASAPFANPPSGDHVLVRAAQGSTTVGSCTAILPGGTNDASECTLSSPPPAGTYVVTATFEGSGTTGGDAGYASASSTSQGLTVEAAPTTTAINPPAPVNVGAAAPVTVSVSASPPAPLPKAGDTVAVAAKSGGTTVATCTASLSGSTPDTGTCSLGSGLALGTYTLTATFGTDPNYVTSSSTADLSVVDGTATTPSLSASTVDAGTTVTYSATVSAASGTPTGAVAFTGVNGLTTEQLCTTPALAGGHASCTANTALVGANTITATFTGTGNFGSSSGTTVLEVNAAEPKPPVGATASQSAQSTSPGGTATAALPGFSVTALGVGALTVASYGSNPTSDAVGSGTGVFYDVAVGAGSEFTSLQITQCDLGPGGTRWSGSSAPAGSPSRRRRSTRGRGVSPRR